MLTDIHTLTDVHTFFNQLVAEGCDFRADTFFEDYVNTTTGLPAYTDEDAQLRNALMDTCFEVCKQQGADIYHIAQEVYLQALKEGVVFLYIQAAL